MKRLIVLILLASLIISHYPSALLDCIYNIENVSRRARTVEERLPLAQRFHQAVLGFYYKMRDFLDEAFYKMLIPHGSSASMTRAIHNIESGTPGGIKTHGVTVVLRSVNAQEYTIAQAGLSVFHEIYGQVKDARIAALISDSEDEFQVIRVADAQRQPGLEQMTGHLIFHGELTQNERDLFTQKSFELGMTPERLVFVTLFATSNERNYLRDRTLDGLRQERQAYEVFMDDIREQIRGFEPTDEVIRLLDSAGYFQAAGVDLSDRGQIDDFIRWYFFSGSEVPASADEAGAIFVEGGRAFTGSYSISDMLEAIVQENIRIRDLLESYGIEINGFVEHVYAEINLKILANPNLTDEQKETLTREFNRSIANIDRWREKLAETGSDDIKDELVEIAKAQAERDGIPHARLQDYVDGYLQQQVSLPGGERGELLYVVQGFVRWVLDYKFRNGNTVRGELDNLMDPEVARRATRLAMFMIFDLGIRDYNGNPIQRGEWQND